MLSAIIATHESERLLVTTLAALVPGATAGLLTDVIVADANSGDDTARVADFAGCKFLSSGAPVGTRLREAVAAAKSPWLLFLRAGAAPDPGWIVAVESFIGDCEHRSLTEARAATFRELRAGGMNRSALADAAAALRALVWRVLRPDQGLLIHRRYYDRIGGHPDSGDAETILMRRLGRRHVAMLGATATQRRLPAEI